MKSSAQLQREARVKRAELSSTLDALEGSMTARQISAELFSLAKDSGMSIARSLAHGARDNPVPALLIGAGLLMMLTKGDAKDGDGDDSPGLLSKAGDMLKDAMSASASAVKGAASSVGQAASSAVDAAKDAVDTARDTVEDTASDLADKARRAAHDGRDTADGLVGRGKQTAQQLADEAQELAKRSRSALEKLAEEQPILLAAAGAVLGAALGAALPVSQAERRYFGEASSRVVKAGRDTVGRVADVVKGETLGDHPETKLAAVAEKAIRVVTKDIRNPTAGGATQSGG